MGSLRESGIVPCTKLADVQQACRCLARAMACVFAHTREKPGRHGRARIPEELIGGPAGA